MNFKKASGITPEKMLPLPRWPCLLQDVLNRRLLFKQTGSSSTKETITIIFMGIGAEETVDAAKICGGAENKLLEQKTQQTFVNGLLALLL